MHVLTVYIKAYRLVTVSPPIACRAFAGSILYERAAPVSTHKVAAKGKAATFVGLH